MARKIFCCLIKLSLICKVLSVYAQPFQQYFHLAQVPPQTVTVPAIQPANQPSNQPIPTTGLPYSALALPNLVAGIQQQTPTNQPSQASVASQPRPSAGLPSYTALDIPKLVAELQSQTANQATTQVACPKAPSGLPPFSALGIPNLISGLQHLPEQQKIAPQSNPSSIDSKLLNNLAIALQLLIVSNILNSPPPDAVDSVKGIRSCPESIQNYPQYESVMPNSQFVGTSGFAEPNLVQTFSPARSSMTLMSPYEALRPSSSYSDSFSINYGVNPRKDFQSPYAMLDNDLFSMNDLF